MNPSFVRVIKNEKILVKNFALIPLSLFIFR